MCKTIDILSELQGKKVKINGKTQLIIIDIKYSLKYNSTTAEITFNEIIKTSLGRHLGLVGNSTGIGKTLNDALYLMFHKPQIKNLSKKQEKVIQRAIKKFNKEK